MALDRQKILNELGSVVNQLQSADCGCMGRLFSNSGQQNYNPGHVPGHNAGYNMQNYYGHGQGYNSPCAGEPCAGARQCLGYCNPPKLYSDTYNYLNRNLMQPVVQEVYQDLKSITPDNTIMNSPMGAQMGMPPSNNPNQGNMNQNAMQGGPLGNPNMNVGHAHVPHVHFGNVSMDNPNSQAMGQMGQGMDETGYGHGGHGMGQMRQEVMGEQGMRQMGQEPGMGLMGQEQGMRMMGHEHGMTRMGQEQGMAQMRHGNDQMGYGMGQMEQGMGQVGQGMGQMGQGISHGEQGMGQVGQGMGQVGQGMGQVGQGMGQVGQGMDHMGQGIGQMEQGIPPRGQGMGQMNQGMDRTGGIMGDMGQHIMKMMTTGNSRPNKVPILDNAPTNPPVNMTHSGDTGRMVGEVNQGQYNPSQVQNHPGYLQTGNMQQERPELQTTQYMSQQNTFPGRPGNAQGDQMHGNMNQMISSARPTGNMNAKRFENHGAYGHHNAGITKFNEMFPGVMKGDLGFDPMAIAIQMNPANQQKSAMDTMEKLMMNNAKGINKIVDGKGNVSPHMQPVINATNAASLNVNQPNQLRNEETVQRLQEPQRDTNQMYAQRQNDQIPQRLYQPPQQMVDPNTGAVVNNPPLPTIYEGSEDPNAKQQLASYGGLAPVADTYKEPILPADTSRNLLHSHHFHQKPPRYYEYNTIGQPVERQYQSADNPSKYSNVKLTVSKTALVGNKPVGRTPSRTQQQVIYNQYKGSQSFTQQNIKPTAHYKVSQSDPRIAPPQNTLEAPIERYNGDSAANDQVTPVNVKFPNICAKQAAEKNFKLRNGLQDQIFSAYPTSAKWSFHGNNVLPYSTGYRFRSK